MPKEQLAGLDQVLDKIDFQSQGGGVQYLQGAESLVVEIVRHRETKRYFWINPEHRNPLPKSATKLVDWLESFQAPGATPFSYHEPTDIRICPSMNENPLPIMSSSNYESSHKGGVPRTARTGVRPSTYLVSRDTLKDWQESTRFRRIIGLWSPSVRLMESLKPDCQWALQRKG